MTMDTASGIFRSSEPQSSPVLMHDFNSLGCNLMEHELLCLYHSEEHDRTPVFCRVHVAQSLVFCVVFVYHNLSCCQSFGFCLSSDCSPSSIYGYWLVLPFWYLQTFLIQPLIKDSRQNKSILLAIIYWNNNTFVVLFRVNNKHNPAQVIWPFKYTVKIYVQCRLNVTHGHTGQLPWCPMSMWVPC